MSKATTNIVHVTVDTVACCATLSSYGIAVYQFTVHYITNANTVPILILLFLYDFRGTWQADTQALWLTDKLGWLTYLLSPPIPDGCMSTRQDLTCSKHCGKACFILSLIWPVLCELFSTYNKQ